MEENSKKTGFFLTLSLKVKMLFAVGCIAGTTLAAGVVGWISFNNVGGTLDHISAQSMPQMTAALDLSETGSIIASGGASLAVSRDGAELKTKYRRLKESLKGLDETIMRLEETGFDAELLAVLVQVETALKSNLDTINEAVSRQHEVNANREQALQQLLEMKGAFDQAIAPYLKETDEKSKALMELAIDEPDEAAFAIFDLSMIYSINQAANSLRANVNDLLSLMISGFNAGSIDDVKTIQKTADTPIVWAKESMATFNSDNSDKANLVRDITKKILQQTTADDGIFALRIEMLQAQAAAQDLARQNERLAGLLTEKIHEISAAVNFEADSAIDISGKAISQGSLTLGAMAIVAIFLSLAIGIIYMERIIVGRISSLSDVMGELARGHLDIEIPDGPQDEIGRMAGTLGIFKKNALDMARLQEEQEAGKAKAAQEKKQALETMANRFEARVQGIVTQVSNSVQALQKTSESMAETTGRVTNRSSQVSEASNSASQNMDTVSDSSRELALSIAEISQSTDEAARVTNNLTRETRATNQAVDSLSEAASRIGDVVNLIDNIAEQTNLLALNATIEAARAGEAGKGFAVVANEVKALANQTAAATSEVTAQIDAIKKTVDDATRTTFNVTREVNGVDQIVAGIAGATTKQMTATDDMSKNIALAADSTRQVTTNITEVLESAHHTGRASSELISAVGNVIRDMELLRQEFKSFLNEIRVDS